MFHRRRRCGRLKQQNQIVRPVSQIKCNGCCQQDRQNDPSHLAAAISEHQAGQFVFSLRHNQSCYMSYEVSSGEILSTRPPRYYGICACRYRVAGLFPNRIWPSDGLGSLRASPTRFGEPAKRWPLGSRFSVSIWCPVFARAQSRTNFLYTAFVYSTP